MKHQVRTYLTFILVFSIALSCLSNASVWAEESTYLKAGVEVDSTTESMLGISFNDAMQSENVKLDYVYWNPNTENESASDGYTSIEAGNDENNGQTMDAPVCSLEKAIDLATENGVIYCMNPYIITKDLSVNPSDKNLTIKRSESYTGNIFQVNPSVNLTLENITLDGNNTQESPVITVTAGGKLVLGENVYMAGYRTYIALEDDAKPLTFKEVPSDSYIIYRYPLQSGDSLADGKLIEIDPSEYVILKNELVTENGIFETYVEDYVLRVKENIEEQITTIYISATGDDEHSGMTSLEPVRSFERAKELLEVYPFATSITVCDTLEVRDTLVLKDVTLQAGSKDILLSIQESGSLYLENVKINGQNTGQVIIKNAGYLEIKGGTTQRGSIESCGEFLLDGKTSINGVVTLSEKTKPLQISSMPKKNIKITLMGFEGGDTVVQGKDLTADNIAYFQLTSGSLYFDDEANNFHLVASDEIYLNTVSGHDEHDGFTQDKAVATLPRAIAQALDNDIQKIYLVDGIIQINQDYEIPSHIHIIRGTNCTSDKIIEIIDAARLVISDDVTIEGGILITYGVLDMYQGTLMNDEGIGVEVISSANKSYKNTFNLYGGTIKNCGSYGVEIKFNGYFNMYGGVIKDNATEDTTGVQVKGNMLLDGKCDIEDIIYIADPARPLILGENLVYPDEPYKIACSYTFIGNTTTPMIKGNEKVKATKEHFVRAVNMQASANYNDELMANCIVVERILDHEAIYINGGDKITSIGVAPGDDSNDGSSILAPVKTFKRARKIIEEGDYEEIDIIVCGTINVTEDDTWSLPSKTNAKILRYHSFNGEMIKVQNADLTLKNIVIDGNKENNSTTTTMAVSLKNSRLTMQDNTSIQNNNNIYGTCGGISIDNQSQLKLKDHATIQGNSAVNNAGGIYAKGDSVIEMYDEAKVYQNSVGKKGAGIYLNQSKLIMHDNTAIAENTSGEDGGGIYEDQGAIELYDGATICKNSSSQRGGGIYQCSNVNSIILENTASICENTAIGDGGGVYQSKDCVLELTNKASICCNQGAQGGGIYKKGTSSMYINEEATIHHNKATNGGGIYQEDGNMILGKHTDKILAHKPTITENTALKLGGGIYQKNGTLSMDDKVSIMKNNADEGGGIYASGGISTICEEASITGNQAQVGGGIYCLKNALSLEGGAITLNEATGNGGGIYVGSGAKELTLIEGTIKDNVDKSSSQIYLNKKGVVNIAKGGTNVEGTIYIEEGGFIQVIRTIIYPQTTYTLQCSNESGGITLVKPGGSIADVGQYLNNFNLKTTKGIVLTKQDKNIISSQVYFVDGEGGNDNNSGSTPHNALRTIEKALGLIGDSQGTIYINGTVTITKDTTWNMHDNIQIYRYTGQMIIDQSSLPFYGDMIRVNKGVLKIINGKLYGKRSRNDLFSATGTILNIQGGTVELSGHKTNIADNMASNEVGLIGVNGTLHISDTANIEGTLCFGSKGVVKMAKGAVLQTPLKVNMLSPIKGHVIASYVDIKEVDSTQFELVDTLKTRWNIEQVDNTLVLDKKTYIYVDGKKGDDKNLGQINSPVRSLSRAYDLLKEEGGTIYIQDTVSLKDNVYLTETTYQDTTKTINVLDGQIKIKRVGTNALISVVEGAQLILEQIEIDGKKVSNSQALLEVKAGGQLSIKSGTVLQNSQGTEYGGAILNDGHTIFYGGILKNNTALRGAGIYNTGTLAIAHESISNPMELNGQEIYLTENTHLDILTSLEGVSPLKINMANLEAGRLVALFDEAAYEQDVWSSIKYFTLPEGKSLIKKSGTNNQLVIKGTEDRVDGITDIFAKMHTTATFVVPVQTTLLVEEVTTRLYDHKGNLVLDIPIIRDTASNTLQIQMPVTEDRVGTYILKMNYGNLEMQTTFTLSAYALTYKAPQNTLLVKAEPSEKLHEDCVTLDVYNGYGEEKVVSFKGMRIRGTSEGYTPCLVETVTKDMKDAINHLKVTTTLSGQLAPYQKGSFKVVLNNGDNITSVETGNIYIEDLHLKGTKSIQTTVVIPFQTEVLKGVTVKLQKDNENWLGKSVCLYNEDKTYPLTEVEGYYISEEVMPGDYEIRVNDGRSHQEGNDISWPTMTVSDETFVHKTVNYYTLCLQDTLPDKLDEEKLVIQGLPYGEALKALSYEGYAFEGYYDEVTNMEFVSTDIVTCTEKQTLKAKWSIINYEISLTQKERVDLVYNYEKEHEQMIIINNIGTMTMEDLHIKLAEDSHYILVSEMPITLAPGEITEIKLLFKTGLPVGKYQENLSVRSNVLKEPVSLCLKQNIVKAQPEVVLTAPLGEACVVNKGSHKPALVGTATYGGKEVKGSLKWQDEQPINEAGAVTWLFTPEDTNSYLTVTGQIKFTLKPNEQNTNSGSGSSSGISSDTSSSTAIKGEANSPNQVQDEIPYYISEGTEVVIGFSAPLEGQIEYIAPSNVAVQFKKNTKYFSDIAGHWASGHIHFVAEREIFKGTQEKIFSPNIDTTRGMFITILGRLYESSYGTIDEITTQPYEDVAVDSYYGKYIAWGKAQGIVKGIGYNRFEPNRSITREEMAMMLYTFAKFMGVTGEEAMSFVNLEEAFVDATSISEWAVEAMRYCKGNDILEGDEKNRLAPRNFATRAEVATVIKKYIEMILKVNKNNTI